MYTILYDSDKNILFACKDVAIKGKSIRGDTGMIAGWGDNIDYVLVEEEPQEYVDFVERQKVLDRINNGETLKTPSSLKLSDTTLAKKINLQEMPEVKIQERMRKLAIDELKVEEELPADFESKEVIGVESK